MITLIAKGVSFFYIFSITFVSGIFPTFIDLRRDVIHYLNALSGGTLITTSLLHLVPEANISFKEAGVPLPHAFPLAECISLLGLISTLVLDSGHSHENHVNDIEFQRKMTKMERLTFVLSLSIHGIFEGLVIGNAPDWTEVLELSLILSFHKILSAMSISIYLISKGDDINEIRNSIALYSVKMPLGVALGTLIYHTSTESKTQFLISGICNSFAGGSLFFSTMSDVIIPSFKHDKHHSILQHKENFILMLTSLVSGCGIMLGMLFLHHSD